MIDESNFPQTINDYVFIKRVGHGGSAYCYLVESMKFEINKLFVAKVIPTSQFALITAENNALMELNHPNIIKLYDRFTFSSYYVLILEYCENKSLAEAIVPNIGIYGCRNVISSQYEQTDLDLFKNCAYQIVNALSFCHLKKCAHRDIKPSNVLIDHYGRMKLTDFGLSIKYQNDNSLEYEYEEEDECDNNSEEVCQEMKDTNANKYQIPLMTPSTNDKTNENHKNIFETKIYYLDNIQFKRRKLSSDSDQEKLNHNFFNITKNDKLLNHRKNKIIRTRSFSNNMTLDQRPMNTSNVNMHTRHVKKIKKRRRILCNSFCGSLVYTAPEIILRQSYDPFAADIWSLGVLFIVMLTGRSPWEGKGQDQVQEKILKREISPKILNHIPSDIIELINKMIVIDPTMRMSIEEVQSSPFFDDPCVLSSKTASSSLRRPTIRTLQQKSHSYNSSLTPISHGGSKFGNKIRNNLISQSQDSSPQIPNSFAQSPLTPSFKRLHSIHLPKTPMIQNPSTFTRKDQQIKSPGTSSLAYFKKSYSMKSNLPIISSQQQQQIQEQIGTIIQCCDDSNKSEVQPQCKIEDNEKMKMDENDQSDQNVARQQNEEMQSQLDISPNNEFIDNSVAHISKCQSLHSPNILHLDFFAKL